MYKITVILNLALFYCSQNFDSVEAEVIFLGNADDFKYGIKALRYTDHLYKNQLYYLIISNLRGASPWSYLSYCSSHLDINTAKVMCKDVFTRQSLTSRYRVKINQLYVNHERPSSHFWDQHFECRGHEDKLVHCPVVYHQQCDSDLPAAINCDVTNASTPAPTLLLDSPGQIPNNRGGGVAFRVDSGIFDGPKEVYVCNEGSFSTNEANVVCTSVGRHSGGKVVNTGQFDSPREFMMKSVSCTGYEQSLYDCVHTFTCWKEYRNYQHIGTACSHDCSGSAVVVSCN